MFQIAKEVFADPVLVGMIILAVLLNAGAWVMKCEHNRTSQTAKERKA